VGHFWKSSCDFLGTWSFSSKGHVQYANGAPRLAGGVPRSSPPSRKLPPPMIKPVAPCVPRSGGSLPVLPYGPLQLASKSSLGHTPRPPTSLRHPEPPPTLVQAVWVNWSVNTARDTPRRLPPRYPHPLPVNWSRPPRIPRPALPSPWPLRRLANRSLAQIRAQGPVWLPPSKRPGLPDPLMGGVKPTNLAKVGLTLSDS
jgi:hypothetical protein